jgi:hypothetical protein
MSYKSSANDAREGWFLPLTKKLGRSYGPLEGEALAPNTSSGAALQRSRPWRLSVLQEL